MNRYFACLIWFAAALIPPMRAEDKPKAEEYVYEGKSAADWAKELKAGNAKAVHALSRLGKDAIGPLMQLVKDPDEKVSSVAANVLANMRVDKATIPGFIALLKDDHYEVRRTAIRLLGKTAAQDAEVGAALKGMLNDRDKAVAEAAEEVLQFAELEPLIDEARGSLKQADFKRALMLADKALAINPNDKRAMDVRATAAVSVEKMRAEETVRQKMDAEMLARRKTFEMLLRQAKDSIEKNEFERPMRIVAEAQKLFPDDPAVLDLRKELETNLRKKMRQDNPFEDDQKAKKKEPAPEKKKVGEDQF